MATTTRKRENGSDRVEEQENSPVGIGVGAAGGMATGAATGAAIGTAVGGPLGTPVGAVIGAIAGGLGGGYVGNEVAKAIDPKAEEVYWEEHHRERPYVEKEATWDQYRPAYRYGVAAAAKTDGKRETFEEMEARLRKGWGHAHGKSSLPWPQARHAVRDAYDRVIQLHEEKLHVNKETVNTGNVNVRKDVVTEQKTISVPVEREEVVIERRAAHGRGSNAADIKSEEIRIPVKEEKVRVSKDVVVKEEVNVKKRKVHDTETVTDNVRHEELKVEGDGKTTVRNQRRGDR